MQAQKKPSELRKFGLTMGAVLAVAGGFVLWREGAVAPYLLGAAAAFVLLAVLMPMLLRPVESIWMKFASLLSFVMTRVILTLAFYLAITPMALLLRLIGKDLLSLRIQNEQQSYWTRVEPDGSQTRPDKPY